MPPKPQAKTLLATRTPHLFLRGRLFYYRRTLAATSTEARRDVCLSLQTAQPALAALMVDALNGILRGMTADQLNDLSNENLRKRLRAIARDYYRAELEELNHQYELEDVLDHDLATFIPENRQHIERLKKELQGLTIRPSRLTQAKKLLAEHLPEASNLDMAEALKRMLVQAEIQASRIYLAKLEGDVDNIRVHDELFQGIDTDIIKPLMVWDEASKRFVDSPRAARIEGSTPTAYGGQAGQLTPTTLADAIEKFLELRRIQNTDAKSTDDIARVLRLLKLVLPSLTYVHELTKPRISEFEMKIAKLPSGFTKLKDLKTLPYEKLIVADPKYKPISDATYDKYRITFRSFLKFCMAEDYLPKMELHSLMLKDKELSKNKRHPFKTAELVALFNAPQYTGHAPDTPHQRRRSAPGKDIQKDAYYWVPLIGALMGLRLSEIIQLHHNDVQTEDSIPFVNITSELEDQSVKNEYSKRTVPIHPLLVQMGFMAYVAAARKKYPSRVFEDIKMGSDGRYSHNFSKYFGRHLKALGIKHARLTFHSLRHSFVDTANKQAGLKDSLIKALVGHKQEGETDDTYGSEYTLKEKRAGMEKIAYPAEVFAWIAPNPSN